MVIVSPLFEGLDLVDLWHLYGQGKQVAELRKISISKVSRRSRDLLRDMGVHLPSDTRGMPEPKLLQIPSLIFLRFSYQQWRLARGCLKVLPTFAAAVALRELAPPFDVLPDVYLSAEAIADHLQMRRVDLMISSSLDLAGELIEQAQRDPGSPFAVVPLFEDQVRLALNPSHPLAGLSAAAPEDCQAFPSAGYPAGIARLAAEAMRSRGLWRFACKRYRFDPTEWFMGMRSPSGLCYETIFLTELIPETRDLTVLPFADPVFQSNHVVMLKELAQQPEMLAAVEMIRGHVFRLLERSNREFRRC